MLFVCEEDDVLEVTDEVWSPTKVDLASRQGGSSGTSSRQEFEGGAAVAVETERGMREVEVDVVGSLDKRAFLEKKDSIDF